MISSTLQHATMCAPLFSLHPPSPHVHVSPLPSRLPLAACLLILFTPLTCSRPFSGCISAQVLIYAKGKLAMFDLPEGKLDKQTSAKFKIPKAITSGMKKTNFYMVDPQPFTLTMGWCQLLGVPVVKKSHMTVNADLWCAN